MTQKLVLFLALALAILATTASWWWGVSQSHWLTPHGNASCDGLALPAGKVFKSHQGGIFFYAPEIEIQPAVILPGEHKLGRCNGPAFQRVFGYLHSRETDPSIQCTDMWKGAGSTDIVPAHEVTERYAEFPWGSCRKLRVSY